MNSELRKKIKLLRKRRNLKQADLQIIGYKGYSKESLEKYSRILKENIKKRHLMIYHLWDMLLTH